MITAHYSEQGMDEIVGSTSDKIQHRSRLDSVFTLKVSFAAACLCWIINRLRMYDVSRLCIVLINVYASEVQYTYIFSLALLKIES